MLFRSTGITTSVRNFLRFAFAEAGIELEFQGENEHEIALIKSCSNPEYQVEIGKEVVQIDKKYFRPTEVDLLIGDPSKANNLLGWKPKYDLQQLVSEMIRGDIELFKRDKYLKDGGHKIMNYHE